MLQQKMSWGPSHAVDDWNPRSLSNFQTFPRAAGGSLSSSAEENSSSPEQETRHNNHVFVPSHSHSKSLVVDDKDKINKTSLPIKGHEHSRSLGGETEAPGLPSLLNGTHPKDPAEEGDVVVIRLGHNDRRFGFSVVGGQEECFAPRIDEISLGSPADKADLEVGDEILEVNGKSLEGASHTEVISHIHQCIRSRTICLRVKRKSGTKLAQDLAAHSNVQDAFVIAVEQQAKERLERLSALKKIKPVDMSELSQQLSSETSSQSSQDFPPLSTKLVTFTDKSSESDKEFKSDSAASQEDLHESNAVPQAENSVVLRLKNSEDQAGGPLRPSPSVISPFGSPSTWVAPELDDSASSKGIEAPDDFRGSPDGHHVSHVTDIPVALVRPPWEDYGHVTEIAVNESPELKKRERLLETSEARLSGSQDALNRTSRASDSDPGRSAGAESQPLRTNPRWAASPNSERSSAAFSSSQESVMGTSREGGQTGSGSRPHSQRSSSTRDGADSLMNVNVNHVVISDWDTGPHREMAVDVPDTFIARTKTPPRYPPPKPLGQAHHNNNNNGNPAKKSASGGGALPVAVNGTAGKPVPPPRDHLRIEEDGRLVNRAQAPQVPAKPKDERPATSPKRPADSANGPSTEEPSREQLERIRKYQEELRKRQELEERQAREEDLLRSSVRGSRKLQALESSPSSSPLPLATPPSTGVLNSGYSLDQEEDEAYNSHVLANLPKIIGVAELTAALQRVQQQLKKNGLIQGQQALEADLAVVQTLLASPDFRAALALQAKVEELFCVGQPRVPIHNDVENLVSECIADLQHLPIPDAAELVDLLGTYEVEGLLYAHDKIAQRAALPPPPYSDADGADVDVDGRQPLPQPLKVMHTPPEVPLQQLGDKIVKIIKIEKTNEPLGATVRNEGDAVVVGRIVRGGAAERSGLLHENDEILEVNNIEMRGKSVNEVCDLLAGMTGTLTFMVVPTRDNKSAIQPAPTLMHVKAHFDYDPEEDLYIPCRELGISFQKGDILHVISQEDPNWWQAYREGEEDQTLAGLIPSKNFQQQREAMKQTIVTDSMDKEKSNKSNFLCAKKHQKKKKKKVLYNANFSDDFDAEEVLTYEEVALYYPRANHKRPIVLIGPPNIGRHELRQRLMQDAERFAAAIPHTSRPKKDNEVDGQDYHFISRAQFEADILSRKFVEHGEYEKAYYGTSVDAIRSVVNRNKICVLNLHPQSLKLLRTSDLKPFIVFVAPPSLEKLRQKKIQRNEPFKDDELKDIIEKAREMEEVYGHYFDMVIVNADDDRAYTQLLGEINVLEREPQWVPASWLRHEHA